ncbi:hypothetical protein KGG72_gp85 [Streptomyces phage Salutena]|uniref:Uncharacterized protein n=1 Tax=Streptomyces phage Salutena TaxID=2767576 RepID=A0A7S6R740_9CAUD|nr:hypothetical protein KGG72_gp85 [Streptomyces phage Salutena]QOV06215.1 hypothetical protein CPT_Salutena_085 [Streptomyces phage Salutena]
MRPCSVAPLRGRPWRFAPCNPFAVAPSSGGRRQAAQPRSPLCKCGDRHSKRSATNVPRIRSL